MLKRFCLGLCSGLILLSVISCTSNKGGGERHLPNISGSTGEVLVVVKEHYWQSEIGDSLKGFLRQPVPALPQIEPRFDAFSVNPSGFDKTFKPYRNIIILKASSSYDQSYFRPEKNIWAKPQLVIKIYAPDEAALTKTVTKNKKRIKQLIKDKEISRMESYHEDHPQQNAIQQLKDEHQVEMTIPEGYQIDKDTNNFVWIAHETGEISQGIFVYHYPYKDTKTFTKSYLIAKRDQFLKKYVPGPNKGSYMATERGYPTIFKELEVDSQFYVKMSGLWQLKNGGFMGGPFRSLTTLDEERQRVVTVEGFVYAPNQNKKKLIWQMEAIIESMDIPPLKSQ